VSKAPVVRADEPTRVQLIAAELNGLPLPGRWAVVGATCAGVIGAVAGLVIGLIVYAPTAPFAVVELGLPATIIGGVIGLLAGVIVIRGAESGGAPDFEAPGPVQLPSRNPNVCR
jgi:hypothetical protein